MPWRNPGLLSQKKSKFLIIGQKLSLGQNFLASLFSLYRYLIETTTTDMDMLLPVYLQFCHKNRLFAISEVKMLLCPLLDDWMLCRVGMLRKEKWSLLQLTASPWTAEASTRERWQFGALTNRKATVAIELPRRVHSTTTRLHYHYIGISELR